MLNLKLILMQLGNGLVGRGFIPAATATEETNAPNTLAIVKFTEWLNNNPEAQEELAELGVQWPMTSSNIKEDEKKIRERRVYLWQKLNLAIKKQEYDTLREVFKLIANSDELYKEALDIFS